MKTKIGVSLLGVGFLLLTSSIWAGGMMPSGSGMGTTMMGGGMMTGDTMTRLMMQDLGNRQMMGQCMPGMQGIGTQGMENMQQNQVQEKMKDSMENGMSSSKGIPDGTQNMEDFHLNQAVQCEKSAEVAQAMMAYGEQMKAGYQTMMGQTSDSGRLGTYKNMMEQYSAMAAEASKLKKDFDGMAQWHKSQAEKLSSKNSVKDPMVGNAEAARSMLTYYEKMKANDQKIMDQMPKDAFPETMKDMMKHYDAMISNTSKLEMNYKKMAKWPKAEDEKSNGTSKDATKEESK